MMIFPILALIGGSVIGITTASYGEKFVGSPISPLSTYAFYATMNAILVAVSVYLVKTVPFGGLAGLGGEITKIAVLSGILMFVRMWMQFT